MEEKSIYIIEPFDNEWLLVLKYSDGSFRREWFELDDKFIKVVIIFGGRIYPNIKSNSIFGNNCILFPTKEHGLRLIDEWIEPHHMMRKLIDKN